VIEVGWVHGRRDSKDIRKIETGSPQYRLTYLCFCERGICFSVCVWHGGVVAWENQSSSNIGMRKTEIVNSVRA